MLRLAEDQRQDQGQDRRGQQRQPGRVQAAARVPGPPGQHPRAGREQGQPDRHVEQEHRPPRAAQHVRGDQQPARDLPGHRPARDHRGVQRHRAGPGQPGERPLDEAEHLRDHRRGPGPLDEAQRDQHPGRGGQPAAERGQGEQPQEVRGTSHSPGTENLTMANVLNDKHLRLLLAARLSKKQNDGRQGMGIETQDERGREWAQREGHTIVEVVADTKSGTVPPWHRKNLKPWVTDPELMVQYDGILAYKNDRLSRGDWDDETEIRKWAMQHGKWLIIADGPWWPPRHDGDKWAWEAAADAARKEWEANRERSVRERTKLASMGKLVDRLPWGYVSAGTKYDRHPEPTREGLTYAPKIWQQVVDGVSLADICFWMDGQGIRTNTKVLGLWSPKTLLRMIRNPIYYGSKQDCHGIEVMKVTPLVDASLWEQANAALDNRPRGRRGPVSGKPALLTSVLFCQRCNLRGIESPMRRVRPGKRRPTDKDRGLFYRCWGKGPNPKGCGLNIALDATDVLAINMLSKANRAPWIELRRSKGPRTK